MAGGNTKQAPVLINKKPKVSNNHIQIDNKVFTSIVTKLGKSPKQALLLIWFIGQADGFKIAKKTVCDALGLKREQSYYDFRAGLEEKGFITVTDNSITINYDVILE